MADILRRPILVGGVSLSFSLWLLQSLHHTAGQLGEVGIFGAIAVGGAMWLFQQPRFGMQLELPTTREGVITAIAQAEAVVKQLQQEASHQAPQLQQRVAQLQQELNREELRLAVTGGKAVGKSTLIQVLSQGHFAAPLSVQETPALFAGSDSDRIQETTALAQALASDLVLFITNGDLTEPEYQTLQQLIAAEQRCLLVFNKQDQYLPEERSAVFVRLQQRLESILSPADVVAIAAAPVDVKVQQHSADGEVTEWLEQPAVEINSLSDRISEIVTQEKQKLVLTTTLRQALALKAEAKALLNAIRRERALPIIEQYQWIAAAAAFANPVPALDLLATAAINAQLVMDLGATYQQKFSLQQAQTVAGTVGTLMVKLGLVELSTKAVSTLLKSNAITYVAGGAVQGVSAAYLTRLAGLSLIEYFQQQELATDAEGKLNLDKLTQSLQNVFQQNQQVAFLQAFVKQGVERLFPKTTQPQLTES